MDMYQHLTIPQLRQIAVERGIQLGNRRRKEEIIQVLVYQDAARYTANQPVDQPMWLPVQPVTPQQARMAAQPITPQAYPRTQIVQPIPPRFVTQTPATRPIMDNTNVRRRLDFGDDTINKATSPIINRSLSPMEAFLIYEIMREKMERAQFQQYNIRSYNKDNMYYGTLRWGRGISGDVFRYQLVKVYRNNKRLGFNPIGYLMVLGDINHVSTLLTDLGFINLVATEDVSYNLLWYLHNNDNYDTLLLKTAEIGYVSGFSDQQLIELLGKRYKGPTDRASLLFAVVTGKSTHNPGPEALIRYATVSQYPSGNAWYIARTLYNIIDPENDIISPYGPYVHIALQPESIIERIMTRVTLENITEFIRRYGMTYNITNIAPTNDQQFSYFMTMIVYYLPVLTRQTNVPPVPILNLSRMNIEDIEKRFEIYTIDEVSNVYEPQGTWNDRQSFFNNLQQTYTTEPIWAWRTRYCNNDEMLNIIQGEPRGDIDKNDPNDPTISYGALGNYSCYQVSELDGSFREDDNGIFQFYNPDWTPNNTFIDKRTRRPVERTFSIEQMRLLRDSIADDTRPVVRSLHDKIVRGLNALQATAIIARRLRNEFLVMTNPEKALVELYLVWLFYYGMWLRFWKGPGFPWPLQWIENMGLDDFCTTEFRDTHAVIQQGVQYHILQDATRHQGLVDWLNALPLVDYNFRTGEAQAATRGATIIKTILDFVAQGRFCLANASDLILRDAYFLIISILNIRNEDEFNQLLQRHTNNLLNLELSVVRTRLSNRTNERPEDIKVLLEREEQLNAPKQVLPRLSLRTIGDTGHTDPQLGRLIAFDE